MSFPNNIFRIVFHIRHHLPKNAENASALILTLLVIVLLSTIVTSFLSTTRTEQTATRNYTSKTQAEQFATMATQQAMAKIQQGFTVTGNATTIITTQPGAIWQYTFAGGSCNAVTGKNPVALFSGNGSGNLTNINNLQNLGNSTNSATSNQWTITGNASEMINVYMENVNATVNGTNQMVGRIAYYVDDEGSKLNANSATGNRTVLNAGNRPQDITALVSSAGSSFNNTINGAFANTSSITGWSHFFRPEQVGAAVSGISGSHTPFITTATPSASATANISHLLTPWGTQRLYINELPITTASVNRIFTSLTGNSASGSTASDLANGQALSNVFGGNFSFKYTPTGVKQIAANILQMRDPNTSSVNASFSYNGSLLGSQNANATNQIPNEYFGYAPYPIITKVGVSVQVGRCGGWNGRFLLFFCPTFEISNPYPYSFNATSMAQIKCDTAISGRPWVIDEVSFDVDHGASYGVQRYTWSSTNSSRTTLREPLAATWLPEQFGTFYLPSIPAFSKIQCQPDWAHWWSSGLSITPSNPITINSVSNMTVTIRDVKIMVNGNIRDWVTGQETGPINCSVRPQTETTDMWGSTRPFPWSGNPGSWGNIDHPTVYWNGNLSDSTAQRFDWIRKTPMNATTNLTASDDIRNWTTTNSSGRGGGTSGIASTGFSPGNWTESTATWIVNTSNSARQPSDTLIVQGNAAVDTGNSAKAKPSLGANSTIPSDPSMNDSAVNAVYPIGNFAGDMREPILPTGNFSCPSDLGLVPTNKRWRRLRMQMQPTLEGSLVPDWAMLEVISFGNSSDPNTPFNCMVPVNINGSFYLPGNVTNTAPPATRTIGVKALAQVLENPAANGILLDTMNVTISSNLIATRFKGATANANTIANAIGNMTWSANSTWDNRRGAQGFPANQYILPSEIMEIAGVADAVSQTDYNNSSSHFKWNEGRASALIPAVSTRSSFFTIYAYAQAGQLQNKNQPESASNPFVVESEALTKTLVEVEITTPATASAPAQYKVKKLYTQSIPMGD